MPKTLMLLEKLKGNAPRLLDSTTFDQNAASSHPQELIFSGQKPADSGVGASVGSCSNLPTVKHNLSKYAQRTFSDAFHVFQQNCIELNPDDRKPAALLLSQPFIKQHKKSSSSSLSLASLVSSCTSVIENCAVEEPEEDTLLTMAIGSKMNINSGVDWDF